MFKKKLINIAFKLFFSGKSKRRLLKNIKLTFFFKELFEYYISRLVVKYYDGKHPKHHLWHSHYKFIIENINPGDKVLDVGCGKSLSYSQQLSTKIDFLDAIDINGEKIQFSIKENKFENIHFSVFDITKDLPSKKYDVIILSHILEHLDRPKEILKKIKAITKKIIVRLPRYDNNWMNLVKKDLGMYYYKSRDHKQEFTLESAIKLIESADWSIRKAFNDIDIKIIATSNNNE